MYSRNCKWISYWCSWISLWRIIIFWYTNKYYLQTRGAPSIANICIAILEEEEINGKRRKELVLYWCFIDDMIRIWDGSEESLKWFFGEINNNKYGIMFSGEHNEEIINFLDLTIFTDWEKYCTKTFLKETDRNCLIWKISQGDKWSGWGEIASWWRIMKNKRISFQRHLLKMI